MNGLVWLGVQGGWGQRALTKWSDCVQVCSQLGLSAEWCRVEAKYAPGDAYVARRPTRNYLLVCFGEVVSRTQKARKDIATSRREKELKTAWNANEISGVRFRAFACFYLMDSKHDDGEQVDEGVLEFCRTLHSSIYGGARGVVLDDVHDYVHGVARARCGCTRA